MVKLEDAKAWRLSASATFTGSSGTINPNPTSFLIIPAYLIDTTQAGTNLSLNGEDFH